MTARILVVQGPNLDLLGRREPEIYGRTTLAEIETALRDRAARWPGLELRFFQSNSEGEILDFLHAEAPRAAGLVINPGGLAHTSVVLRDAVAAVGIPTIEVHLSNIHAREPFRRRSLLAGACRGTISGLGPFGYEAALEVLARGLADGGG
jgi:3-dehydroquinate dehydratase-2